MYVLSVNHLTNVIRGGQMDNFLNAVYIPSSHWKVTSGRRHIGFWIPPFERKGGQNLAVREIQTSHDLTVPRLES